MQSPPPAPRNTASAIPSKPSQVTGAQPGQPATANSNALGALEPTCERARCRMALIPMDRLHVVTIMTTRNQAHGAAMSSHSTSGYAMHWNPLRTLVVLALWLAGIATAAVLASGCAPAQAATTGAIFLQWSTIDVQRQPVFCEEVQARSVALRLRNLTTGAMVNTAFPCDSSPRSATVPPAIYDIDIELHAADGRVLATAPRHTAVVVVANQVTRLIPVTFEISTSGTLVGTLAAANLRNCRSIGAAGAGITETTISLERLTRRTVCYPTTFSVRDGHNNELRQYVANDCVSPPVAECIELTERIVARLLPGIYRMRVVGLRGGVACHKSESSFVVSPNDVQTITSDLIRESAPGCPQI